MNHKTGDLIEISRREYITDSLLGRYTRVSQVPAIVVSHNTMSTWVMDRPVKIEDRTRYLVIAIGKICSIDEEDICRKLSQED